MQMTLAVAPKKCGSMMGFCNVTDYSGIRYYIKFYCNRCPSSELSLLEKVYLAIFSPFVHESDRNRDLFLFLLHDSYYFFTSTLV